MAERILLIEDDSRLAEMVSEYLGEAGFYVSIPPGGRAGLERFAREPFDALVLDLMLPDIDWKSVVEGKRGDLGGRRIIKKKKRATMILGCILRTIEPATGKCVEA